jgi:hypothetical protein
MGCPIFYEQCENPLIISAQDYIQLTAMTIVKQCIINHKFLSLVILFLFLWYMNRRIGEEVSANLKEPLFFLIVVFEWEN